MFWIQEKSHYQKPPVEPKIIFLLIAKKKSKNTLKNWGIGLMKKRLGDIELENRTTFLHEIIRWFATTEKSDAIITKPPILILLFSWSCMRGILYCCSGQTQHYPFFSLTPLGLLKFYHQITLWQHFNFCPKNSILF